MSLSRNCKDIIKLENADLTQFIFISRVVLENCIVCDKAIIKKGSVLKNCLVGLNFIVEEGTTKDKAHLTGEGFMEIE